MVNGKTKLLQTFGICIFAQEVISELLHLFLLNYLHYLTSIAKFNYI